MKKATIDGKIYDVYNDKEYDQYRTALDNSCALEHNGFVYPVRAMNDNRPGIRTEGDKVIGFFNHPETEEDKKKYSADNIIDFNSNSMKELIEKSEILREQEKEIRISPDNRYEYKPDKDDDPDLDLLKEALAAKKCDIDKYEDRFNGNYTNDKRTLNAHSITSKKLKRFADAYDFKITMIIEDKSPDVANPMGRVISRVIANGGGEDE